MLSQLKSMAVAAMLSVLPVCVHSVLAADSITVFAAASLKETLGQIAQNWTADTGKQVKLSFAASSALARQIDEGAPADVFISADLNWMDHLDKGGQLREGSRVNLLGNRIVLVAPSTSSVAVQIRPGFDLAHLLGSNRLAMGNVESVPAGIYGKQALTSLGVWESVKGKIAQADNVRAALLLVSRQEAPFGIVYETDARVDPGVKIVDRFPQDSHPAIIYPAAVVKASTNPDAAAFLSFLQTAASAQIFKAAGFTVLGQTP
ncbi:molybdate transport system substrate-binding protein [Agrobacterium vitis]|nr:molybdate transport system substrate-binding protein [Agrobacterium vitis]MBE1438127.1 molybdate transport system substrate-binding protein [Agrobacterium vitis]